MRKAGAALLLLLAVGSGIVAVSGGGGGSGARDSSVSSALAPLELRQTLGGGFKGGGLTGSYYAGESATGAPAFVRKDVRIDFDWGTVTAPGGSPSPGYRDVTHDHFAVVWNGALIPAFGETYTLFVDAVDGARLSLRPTGGGAYTTVVDFLSGPAGNQSGTYTFEAGQSYDVKLEYRHSTGPARVSLMWSSASFQREVIDPLAGIGQFVQYLSQAYTDLVKGARNVWDSYDYSLGLDESGWPRGDCLYVIQESSNQGMDISPLMRGKIAFQFRGRADGSGEHLGLEAFGNVEPGSLSWSYDAGNNITSGTFTTVEGRHSNVVQLKFFGVHRTPGGAAGFTDLRIMRPNAVDSTTAFPLSGGPIFTPQYKDAYSRFTAIRYQMVADYEREWSERTPPTWFNQSSGQLSNPKYGNSTTGIAPGARQNATAYAAGAMVRVTVGNGTEHVYYANNSGTTAASQPAYPGYPGEVVTDGSVTMIERSSANGPSWEYKILLANETGRDLVLSVPILASDDYLQKLAQLIRYGSDGANPYTSETASPAYPPLNPNLRVYFEIGNELWNSGGVFWNDWHNVFNLVYAHADANDAHFQVLNFDNLSTNKTNGEYDLRYTWTAREWVALTKQASDIFASVWGTGAMHRRVRPMFEWQYANTYAIGLAMDLAENYYNNGDGIHHVDNPQPPSAYLWGGGGATYYGATDPDGLTNAISGYFGAPTVSAGYSVAPAGGPWTFTSTAGIARPTSGAAETATGNVSGDDVPHQATTRGARANATAYSSGDTIYLTAGDGKRHVYRCTQSGTSASSASGLYAGTAGETVTDGTAVFTEFTSQVGYIQGTGRMAYTFTVPSFTSPYFAVSFKAANRLKTNGTADAQTLDVYVDGTKLTAPTYSGGTVYRPPAYNNGKVGPDWGAQNVSWTSSHYYSTRTFQASAAGESHTVEIRGLSTGSDIAFISDVRLASVDAIFASGVPGGGGQAAGQPDAAYRLTLWTETLWARAYGLQPSAYEGGWSIGGDDQGTMLQNQAKMGGAGLTRTANKGALNIWREFGGSLNVQGTYAQWPAYSDYYAQEGLVDPGSWPLIQGMEDALNEPPPAPSVPGDAYALGANLTYSGAALHGNTWQNQLRARGSWAAWQVLTPTTGIHAITVYGLAPSRPEDSGHVTAEIVVDGTAALTTSTPGNPSVTVSMAPGLHVIRLQSLNTGFASYDRVVVDQ